MHGRRKDKWTNGCATAIFSILDAVSSCTGNLNSGSLAFFLAKVFRITYMGQIVFMKTGTKCQSVRQSFFLLSSLGILGIPNLLCGRGQATLDLLWEHSWVTKSKAFQIRSYEERSCSSTRQAGRTAVAVQQRIGLCATLFELQNVPRQPASKDFSHKY